MVAWSGEQPGLRGRLSQARDFAKRFPGKFNLWFARMEGKSARCKTRILSRPTRGVTIFFALIAVTVVLFMRLPTAFCQPKIRFSSSRLCRPLPAPPRSGWMRC